MTCICGHHEEAHLSGLGLCAAPEGCNCNHFRKAVPKLDPFVDETKAVQDAEWLAGSEADTAERNLARAYLALLEQVATLTADRDAWEVSCHNATIEKHEALAFAPRGVTEAMVERFIAAMDVASDADVGREEGIRYAFLAALAEARKRDTMLRELHMPIPRAHQDGGGTECAVCYDSDGVAVNYPCATIRLLPPRTPQPETPE